MSAAGAAIALTALSSISSSQAAQQEGVSTAAAYRAQAEVNELNAKNTAIQTAYNENVQRASNRQQLAQKVSGAGAAGTSGTALGSYLSSYQNAEENALNIRAQGMAERQNYLNQAAYDRTYAKSAITAGEYGAANALLGGGAQTFAIYAGMYA